MHSKKIDLIACSIRAPWAPQPSQSKQTEDELLQGLFSQLERLVRRAEAIAAQYQAEEAATRGQVHALSAKISRAESMEVKRAWERRSGVHVASGGFRSPIRYGVIALRSADPASYSYKEFLARQAIGIDAIAALFWVPPDLVTSSLMNFFTLFAQTLHLDDLKRLFPAENELRALSAGGSVWPSVKASVDDFAERQKFRVLDFAKALTLHVDVKKDGELLKILEKIRNSIPLSSLKKIFSDGPASLLW